MGKPYGALQKLHDTFAEKCCSLPNMLPEIYVKPFVEQVSISYWFPPGIEKNGGKDDEE